MKKRVFILPIVVWRSYEQIVIFVDFNKYLLIKYIINHRFFYNDKSTAKTELPNYVEGT